MSTPTQCNTITLRAIARIIQRPYALDIHARAVRVRRRRRDDVFALARTACHRPLPPRASQSVA
jgi:hypothetical protein